MLHNKLWELIAKKLSGEADAEELARLEELLRENPDMHYPMQTVADLWHQTTPDKEDAQQAFSFHSNRMKALGLNVEPGDRTAFETPVANNKKKYLVFSLFSIVIIILGFYVYTALKPSPPVNIKASADKSEVSTRYGSRTKLLLPDGSQVWLNSGSKISYDKTYGNGIREVALSGEAYFDVIKNSAHPFIIHTSTIDIKVLGTAFNVKSYPGEKNTETSLIRGSIEVTMKDRPAEKIILKPNEKLVIANEEMPGRNLLAVKTKYETTDTQEPFVAVSHLTYAPKDSTVIETSWMENKFIFRSESFVDLSLRMERWYSITFRFTDENIKKKKFTGVFENETVQQALDALKLTTPFTYKLTKKEVIISSRQ